MAYNPVNIAAAASNQTATSGTVVFSNSNSITFGMTNSSVVTASYSQSNQQLAVYAAGNTTNNTSMTANASSLDFAGSGIASVEASGGSVIISATQSNQAVSASGGSFTFQTLVFTNFNGLTFSNNGGSIAASYTVPSTAGLISAINVSASNTSSNLSNVVFSNSNGVSFGLSNSTITASFSSGGGGGESPTINFYQNRVQQNSVAPYTTLAIPFHTMIIQPLSPLEGYGFPGNMTISTLMMDMSATGTATSGSSSYASAISFGLYEQLNSSQLSLVDSVTTSWSAAANTGNTTGWLGARFLTFHSSLWSSQPVLSNNENYWYAIIHGSTNYSNVGAAWIGQYIGASTQRSGTFGVSQTTNTSLGMVPFLGIYSASISSFPSTLANSQIDKVNVSAGFAPAIVFDAEFGTF